MPAAEQCTSGQGKGSNPAEKTKPNVGRRAILKSERGLPDTDSRVKLAQVWLEYQHEHWRDYVKAGIIPENTKDVAQTLADEFERAFLSRVVQPVSRPCPKEPWGAAYARYSSNQQNKRSIDDQLFLQLQRARHEGIFIPWQWVFADAGVSGTTTNRTGYRMLKSLACQEPQPEISAIFIDELARATRNAIEALSFGQLMNDQGVRLLGVSDNFDSGQPQAKASLMFSAFVSEQFVDQHRYRVRRGHLGAEKRGSAIGRIPVGIKRVPLLDRQGRQVVNGRGKPITTYGIDHENQWIVEHIDKRFVDDGWSATRIAVELNEMRAQGKDSWTSGTVTSI